MSFFTPEKKAKIQKSLKELSQIYAQLENYKENKILIHKGEVKPEEKNFN